MWTSINLLHVGIATAQTQVDTAVTSVDSMVGHMRTGNQVGEAAQVKHPHDILPHLERLDELVHSSENSSRHGLCISSSRSVIHKVHSTLCFTIVYEEQCIKALSLLSYAYFLLG